MAADPRLRRSGSVASRRRLPVHRDFLAEGQEQADRPSGRPDRELPGLSPDLVALVSALRKIPETQRRAIVLHHLAGLSVEEIAHETGLRPGP